MAMWPVHDARAMVLEASVGYGYEISPDRATQATNIMITPGVELLEVLKLELGVVGAYGAVRSGLNQDLQLEFRPMIVLAPPVIPLYARAIFSVIQPFSSADRTIAYGGALGFGVSVPVVGLGVFAEVGVLPRSVTTASVSSFVWVLEGRAGLSFSF